MLPSADAFTVLSLGDRGAIDGSGGFTLVGQTLARSENGLWWTEWRLRRDDGQMLFLAESAGRLVLFHEATLLPTPDELVPGAPLDRGWFVTARGRAIRVARWGEIDEAPRDYAFAELVRDDEIATIEWPHTFRGKVVTLSTLGLRAARPLQLWAVPDLSPPKDVGWLPVGATGTFRERKAEIVGCIARVSGDAAWEEYLVRTDETLEWLVLADGAWSVLEPVVVGPTDPAETTEASVTWAAGALPWEIAIGERSTLSEHHGITREVSAHGVTWSRALPLATADIAKSFGKRALPRP